MDKTKLNAIIDKHQANPSHVLAIFQDVQAVENGLPKEAVAQIAKKLEIPQMRVQGMATFFDSVCKGTACRVPGGDVNVAVGETTCMVDATRYFLHFLANELCGRCVSCREGMKHLCLIVDRICEGKGQPEDLPLLVELSETVEKASQCAWGQSATFPLRSTLHYFEKDYLEHINDKKCRAKVCKNLIEFSIKDSCTGCTLCVRSCPVGAISGEKKQKHQVDKAKCIKCGVCFETCNFSSVHVE